jgi:integrase
MASRSPSLSSHLEWHNGSIRVTVAIPRALQGQLGATRLKQSLKTDSPALAERIKHGVIQALKNRINVARKAKATTSLSSEAMDWCNEIEGIEDDRQRETLELVLHDRARELEASEGYEVSKGFHDIASGQATPLETMLETYVAGSGLRERSGDEARRAVRVLRAWCETAKVPASVEAISRKVAGRFVTDHLLATMSRKTTEKYLSFLSGYWKFLIGKGYATERVWSEQLDGIGREKTRRAQADSLNVNGSTGKRPYTKEEARKLLYAPVSDDPTAQRTADLTWLGALSGMRLDEICRLRVTDAQAEWFVVNAGAGEGKTDASRRRVPIHPALSAIVARRAANKKPTDYLIEDLPEPEPGSFRERSMPASKAYTRFRRDLGIDERAPGQRQSNVDFHSWRRWFIQEARDAGAAFWTLADLVGHDTKSLPGGLTMGRYPGPAADAALIEAVKSVMPPEREEAKAP